MDACTIIMVAVSISEQLGQDSSDWICIVPRQRRLVTISVGCTFNHRTPCIVFADSAG